MPVPARTWNYQSQPLSPTPLLQCSYGLPNASQQTVQAGGYIQYPGQIPIGDRSIFSYGSNEINRIETFNSMVTNSGIKVKDIVLTTVMPGSLINLANAKPLYLTENPYQTDYVANPIGGRLVEIELPYTYYIDGFGDQYIYVDVKQLYLKRFPNAILLFIDIDATAVVDPNDLLSLSFNLVNN